MIQKKLLFPVVLLAVPLNFLSHAMESGTGSPVTSQLRLRSSSLSSSPRSSANSPRSSEKARLNRSGSLSVVGQAAVANATLNRVASSERIASLKKRNSVPALVLPDKQSEQLPTGEQELLKLSGRSILRSSQSPREKDEAELVFGDSERTEPLFEELIARELAAYDAQFQSEEAGSLASDSEVKVRHVASFEVLKEYCE